MKKIIYIILIIIIILGGVILILNREDKNIKNEVEIKYVSMDDIVQIMNENEDYIILDVRTVAEYNEGHIPNAICIPNETIDETIVSKLPNKKQMILIYCRSGNRSKQAAEKLKKLGYNKMIIACLKGNPTNEFYKHIGGVYIKDGLYKRLSLAENVYYFENI